MKNESKNCLENKRCDQIRLDILLLWCPRFAALTLWSDDVTILLLGKQTGLWQRLTLLGLSLGMVFASGHRDFLVVFCSMDFKGVSGWPTDWECENWTERLVSAPWRFNLFMISCSEALCLWRLAMVEVMNRGSEGWTILVFAAFADSLGDLSSCLSSLGMTGSVWSSGGLCEANKNFLFSYSRNSAFISWVPTLRHSSSVSFIISSSWINFFSLCFFKS